MMTDPLIPREGELYKTLTIAGHSFELRYGYYEEREKAFCPPVLIYPDLVAAPLFAPDGSALVTQIQDPCPHFELAAGREEKWCGDCIHFDGPHPEIGICRCEHRINHKIEEEIE